MGKRTVSNIIFWTVAALAAALFVGFMLALAGVVPVDPAPEPTPTEEAAPPPEPEPEPALPQATTGKPAPAPSRTTSAAPTTTVRKVEPARTSVVITATRGDCWFQARVGSENGRVLDERVLAQGESAQFEAEQVWLVVGAAGNVDVTVDGKPREISSGTVSMVLRGSASES